MVFPEAQSPGQAKRPACRNFQQGIRAVAMVRAVKDGSDGRKRARRAAPGQGL
jgi:hypothetical protein